jgi:hypothetical protein
MGQYYRAVNVTKREYVDVWDLGGFSKLWEWCANRWAGLFPYLLRKSGEHGGGDVGPEATSYAGRWAGDVVYLVGDYDASALFQQARREFVNISGPLAEEYNRFIGERLRLPVGQPSR